MTSIKNDLFLRALRGESVERPPVWMMRQAGRYLPDYMKLRAKYSFFERVENPEPSHGNYRHASRSGGSRRSYYFSDILVIPQALGFEVTMNPGEGPRLPQTVQTPEAVDQIAIPDVDDRLHYVYDALALTKKTLDGRVPLIGFAGSPWTILCYMVEGQGSKTLPRPRLFCFAEPRPLKLCWIRSPKQLSHI